MLHATSLTPYEQSLVGDAGLLLAKNAIIKKVVELFGGLIAPYGQIAASLIPAEVRSVAPKISKGEQYLGLPYVVLDYPRVFTKADTFAIRTFFWWGNSFSLHLQMSGKYKTAYAPQLQDHIAAGHFDGWYIGVHESEWHHHFETDNYQLIETNCGQEILNRSAFLKLAKKIPLSEWDNVDKLCVESFSHVLNMLNA